MDKKTKTTNKTTQKTTKKKVTKRKKKSSNPLYVVSKDGKEVEEASNYLELIFKKLGLDFIYSFLTEYIKGLLELVNSYPMLVEIQKMIDQVVDALELAQMRIQKNFSFF